METLGKIWVSIYPHVVAQILNTREATSKGFPSLSELNTILPDMTSVSFQITQESIYSSLVFLICIVIAYLLLYTESTEIDLVNNKSILDIWSFHVKANFVRNAYDIITERLKAAPGKPFRVTADVGEVTILPPEYAHEIRNDERFSFTKAAYPVNVDIDSSLDLFLI